MRKYTIEDFKNRFGLFGFKWFNFHIIGVRASAHVPDKFMDNIYIVWGNSLYCFSATTIPGVHWLQKPMNPKGTAIVVANKQFEDAYALGLHKGKEALIQVKPILVYRDNDKDNLAEEIGTPITAGAECRIDIHGTGPTVISVLIGAWSAACQVLNNPTEYKEFISLCKRSVLKSFTYTLLKEF